LGNTGSRFVVNLLKEGFDVAAYDLKRGHIDRISSKNIGSFRLAESNDDLERQFEIIFTILSTIESANPVILVERVRSQKD
jgi:3-hydroxyisobutyrate dehydrogenase-like beta-hydroxyacid dehydrogenase